MTKFTTIKELEKYIPNCIICGKNMGLYLESSYTKFGDIIAGFSNVNYSRLIFNCKVLLKDNVYIFSKILIKLLKGKI